MLERVQLTSYAVLSNISQFLKSVSSHKNEGYACNELDNKIKIRRGEISEVGRIY